jgi:transposase InsO family protein
MPWEEWTVENRRRELISLARAEDANLSALASRFGVSRKTLYKWLKREAGREADWWRDRSRRPHHSPARVHDQVEDAVLAVRGEHSAWGARKILHVMALPQEFNRPSPSTVCAILHRHGLVSEEESAKRREFQRFERALPNEMWQTDYKGSFATRSGRCHPLTIIDDHSRYALAVRALPDEGACGTRAAMTEVFRKYGMPHSLLVDNGSCWGRTDGFYSDFGVWLLRLGIDIIYARPRHPQTKGKNERFNRTLKVEVIQGRMFLSLDQCQAHFDEFQHIYNTVRPHEALNMAVPASRYRVSERTYPERLPRIEYFEDDIVLRIRPSGILAIGKERYLVGRALKGEWVALRPGEIDGIYNVFYCRKHIAVINRTDKTCRPC